MEAEKLERFQRIISAFADKLEKEKSLHVHRQIDITYYLQKAAELQELNEQLVASKGDQNYLQQRICLHYVPAYCRWKKDVRWLARQIACKHATQIN